MSAGTVTLYIAMSVDGYIADANGGVSWLAEFEVAADDDHHDDYAAFFENVDCLVMGATTYEQILSFDGWSYEDKPTYVFTHRDLPAATDAVEFVDRPVAAASTDLKERYSHIWLVGGAQLTRAFLGEQEIDEFRLSIVPVLLGGGVSLFGGEYETQQLELLDATRTNSGIVEHHYEIRG